MLHKIKKGIDKAELKVLRKITLRDYVGAIYKQAKFKVKKNIKHKGHKIADLMVTFKDGKRKFLIVIKQIDEFPYIFHSKISEKKDIWYLFYVKGDDFYRMPTKYMKQEFEEEQFYSKALPMFNSEKLKKAREEIKKKTLESKPLKRIKKKFKKKFKRKSQKQTQDEDLEEEQQNN